MAKKQKTLLGWREWVALPGLGIHRINAKVDTGARTSALDTARMEEFEQDGVRKVRFELPRRKGARHALKECIADVVESRLVKDSGGRKENRVVICTQVVIGAFKKDIEITLTNRKSMRFPMLLGRTAIRKEFNVNPGKSYLAGEPRIDT